MNGLGQNNIHHLYESNMVATSLCFGYWAECPQECSMYTPENNQKKCFVWRTCYNGWKEFGGRLGLFDLLHPDGL